MKLKFLGASGEVTGSSYMLTSDSGESILIDCGLFQGKPEVDALNYKPFEIDPSKLLGVILTHAHLDHCGRLPLLIKLGFTKSIWMTPPTSDITNISLYDTAKISQEDDKTPIYTNEDVDKTIALFKTVEYDTAFEIGEFNIVLRNAGHILGSASVEIIDKSNKTDIKKVAFSGDLGNSPEPLIKPTEPVTSSDAVVVETTYGDRLHPDQSPQDKVQSEINEIEKTGGVLLIPAFSIERSQELLHLISHLKSSGKVKNETQVFFDGHMGERVTTIFEKYHQYYNQELSKDMLVSDPFQFPDLKVIEKSEDRIYEANFKGPKVIIAGSGMMTGGRILGYASKYLPLDSTRLLFVGYQAEETLGRQILEGQKLVNIEGKEIVIKASVNETQAMSSHADQSTLLNWIKKISGIKKIILTHGEDTSRNAIAEKIKSEIGINDILIPTLNEEVTL